MTVTSVTTGTDEGRAYWCEVLSAGGFTAIPRWTHDPAPGIHQYEEVVAGDLMTAVDRLADDLAVSASSILLAAHAKVLDALTGEPQVSTGLAVPGTEEPLPCRLSADPVSWRAIVGATHRAAIELRRHAEVPVNELRVELGLTEPPFETVFDPEGIGGDLADETVLWIGVDRRDNQTELQIRYRTNAVDAGYAHRIAGYHLAALAAMVADPDADHRQQSLLSPDELHFQLETLKGPHQELPDCRLHDLFEQRVALHPNVVAAVHGDHHWTYHELNARANRLGRALRERGVGPETVVAVVTERNLDWMASVLAIFKIGGGYLPIEPHFPAERIATTLARADCAHVLTETASTTNLDQALGSLEGVQKLLVDTAYAEDHSDRNLGIEVGPDQLAYIYFTSGSTGEPKGAMCEHGGMINHLYAKIADLRIGRGEVVAQIAPQCFDISLWQLVSALLVGGRTLLVEQDTLLNPEKFVDTIVEGHVAVMQVVPSYLEVLLSYLEQHPRRMPDLHCVSVTGEALTVELTQRFFATVTGVKLVNAYGLTETSDDTNHEVMKAPPSGSRVPLGRVVNNVEVRIVDENLSPVPLGAPGEIVFSGICVGRGYINDPERTRHAFMPDPLREGQRLYRSGDFGCWGPDRKVEFLGRRDAQVKIRGFRIEIGEIENAMLRIPGVRQGVVVVDDRDGRGKQLVAFYSGEPLQVDAMQAELARSLPHYMVPPAIHWREALPLTDNGKVNRKELRALAPTLDAAQLHEEPNTETEAQLAEAWSRILDVPQVEIGRFDNFFDLGGSSLSAVELVIDLDGAISLKEVTRYPVLADQAVLVEGASGDDSGLLQLLTEPNESPSGTLVCFPSAGGNAVNFQAMSAALRDSGLAVYAVELPGHQLTVDDESLMAFSDVVETVVAEIADLAPSRLLLWGHSAGAALAMETARRLEAAGVDVQRVFLGAQMLGDVVSRRAQIDEVSGRSDSEIAAALSVAGGYREFGEPDGLHATHVGAAVRHDCLSAHRYVIDALQTVPRAKLDCPVTVVVAADDPTVADSSRRRDWKLLAENVDVYEIAAGGHYFLRTRPAEMAELIVRTVRLSMTLTPS